MGTSCKPNIILNPITSLFFFLVTHYSYFLGFKCFKNKLNSFMLCEACRTHNHDHGLDHMSDQLPATWPPQSPPDGSQSAGPRLEYRGLFNRIYIYTPALGLKHTVWVMWNTCSAKTLLQPQALFWHSYIPRQRLRPVMQSNTNTEEKRKKTTTTCCQSLSRVWSNT